MQKIGRETTILDKISRFGIVSLHHIRKGTKLSLESKCTSCGTTCDLGKFQAHGIFAAGQAWVPT